MKLVEGFGARLRATVAEHGPLCVGIDPHASLLVRWGLSDDIDGLRRFADIVVSAFGHQLAVAKPQSAFFERHGSGGIAVLESLIRQLRDTGVLVLLDVKRGDIGSTIDAYADAYLDPFSALYVDAITANPYLGFGSLQPMIDKARRFGSGVFVLARTSNPESGPLQLARHADGRTVAQTVIDEISQVNAGMDTPPSIGVVIGATADPAEWDLSRYTGPILVPGLGTQGGTPQSLRNFVATEGSAGRLTVLPTYSREVLAAGPKEANLRAAADQANAACAAILTPTVR